MKITNKALILAASLLAVLGLSACSDSSSSNNSNNKNTNTGTSAGAYQSELFTVRGDWAIMDGEITGTIVSELNRLVSANPQVKTIVMQEVPGSSDDEANLQAGLRLRELGLNTYLPPGGHISSGGVDLFLAGNERFAAQDVLVGVHSWATEDITDASTLPRGHEDHDLYLDYFQAIGIDPDFYWFTIQAANANNIHWMSHEERIRYKITTRNATDQELSMITHHAVTDSAIAVQFSQYTWVDAANNKPIHIFGADGVSSLQMSKARSVMAHYLSNVEGLLNKDSIANKLGDDQASLFVFATEQDAQNAFEGSLGELPLAEHGQDLYATEIFVEGDNNYLNRLTVDGRDATYEEVLHLVQGHGLAPAEQALQQRIVTLAENALMDNVWNPSAEDVAEWNSETDQNGYTSQNYEYLAAAVEGYYGLWGHTDEGLDGYLGINRTAQQTQDPNGLTLIEEIWPNRIYSAMPISADFPAEETFSLSYQADKPYTHQSQHLLHVYLTGSNNSHILGNDGNNVLQGNAGDNRIDGNTGDEDVVLFSGLRREYQVEQRDGVWHVIDSVAGRDGHDELVNIDVIEFRDEELSLNRLP